MPKKSSKSCQNTNLCIYTTAWCILMGLVSGRSGGYKQPGIFTIWRYIHSKSLKLSLMHISQEHFFSFKIELPTPTKYQQHFIYNYMYVYSPYFLLEHCNKFGFFGGVQRTQIDFSSESNFQMYQFSLNLEFFQKYKSLIFSWTTSKNSCYG